jgi:hypothetical protein
VAAQRRESGVERRGGAQDPAHAHILGKELGEPADQRSELGVVGTLEQILRGPSTHADGSANIIGALRKAMATTGYSDLKEFQRIDVVLDPE